MTAPSPEKAKKLTANQKRFAEEYAVDRNATQAYFRAFGRTTAKGKKRSYQGSSKSAQRLLQNALIQAEIEECLKEQRRRSHISAQRVLRELAAIAFLDPDDYYQQDDANGGLPMPKPWREIPPRSRKAIASVKVKRRRLKSGDDATEWEIEELEYKHHSKTDALDKLMKHLGLTADASALGELIAAITSGKGTQADTPAIPACEGDTVAGEESV